MFFVTDDFMDMMPSYHNLVKSVTESEDPPLNVSRSKGDQGRQIEALTEGKDSDARQDEGVHDDRHQKFTVPNHEITSPIDAAYKSIAMGEQNHGAKSCLIMFDEAHKGDVSKLYRDRQ
jgi:HSP90 family molecular chaperone